MLHAHSDRPADALLIIHAEHNSGAQEEIDAQTHISPPPTPVFTLRRLQSDRSCESGHPLRFMAKRKYADRFVGKTPKESGGLEDRHRKVLEIFSKYEFERVLDVGCGDGNFTMLMARACKAKEVYGIEISEKGVEMARKMGLSAISLTWMKKIFRSKITSSMQLRR
jgi:hypothetical protein